MRYLLDTNVIAELARDPHGPVALKALRIGEARLCTSVVVACELAFGCAKKGSAKLTAQVDAVLGALEVLPLDAAVISTYATVRNTLESADASIGANDLLIASHATALGATVVTSNEREFRRVRGLRVENWAR